MRDVFLFRLGIVLLVLSLFTPTFAAQKTWTVTGTIKVEHRLRELKNKFGSQSPLKGIQVKVSARTKVLGKWATWNSWDTVRTNSNGVFTVKKTKNEADRQIKIQVKFDSDKVELRHSNATSSLTKVKWYTIFDNGKTQKPGKLDVGLLPFKAGANQDRGKDEPRRHADFWVASNLMIDQMASYGSAYGFKKKVKIKHPHNGVAGEKVESSYANPSTQVVYIFVSKDGKRDHFNVSTLWHEMAHIWAYQHCSGELGLAWQLFADGSTHDAQEKTFVAFHEGWAEYVNEKLHQIIFKEDRTLPLSRSEMKRDKIGTLPLLEMRDDGWTSIFHTLSTPKLHLYDFNTSSSRIVETGKKTLGCDSPSLTFKELLMVFNPNEKAGYKKHLTKDEMTLDKYLKRLNAIHADIDSSDISAYKKLLDAKQTVQPSELFCNKPEKKVVPRGTLTRPGVKKPLLRRPVPKK